MGDSFNNAIVLVAGLLPLLVFKVTVAMHTGRLVCATLNTMLIHLTYAVAGLFSSRRNKE